MFFSEPLCLCGYFNRASRPLLSTQVRAEGPAQEPNKRISIRLRQCPEASNDVAFRQHGEFVNSN